MLGEAVPLIEAATDSATGIARGRLAKPVKLRVTVSRGGLQRRRPSESLCAALQLARVCVAADVQVYPGRTALVVSLENITENVYLGNQRSMTIPNCLFRLGGAAVLLSNRRRHWWTARSVASQV